MDFQFTHEQRLWGDTVHSFMDKEVGREYTREHDANREFPEEVFKKMTQQGWLGLLVDEQDGGSAADPIMFALFCEAIGKFSLDTAACIMTSMFTATNISRHGTAEQKRRFLPRLELLRERLRRTGKPITIGNSHHFLFWARNAQNSLTRLSPWDWAAAFSNSFGTSPVDLLIVKTPS